MQIRTSLSRFRSQVTAIAALLRPGLALMKASSMSDGAIVFGSDNSQKFGRNFHRGAGLADGLEIGPRAQVRSRCRACPIR